VLGRPELVKAWESAKALGLMISEDILQSKSESSYVVRR